MLTTTPKVGDRVLLVDRNDNRRQRGEPKLLSVDKVGTKYLTISQHGRPNQFPFTGIRDNYELWDSQEAYDRQKLSQGRNRMAIAASEVKGC